MVFKSELEVVTREFVWKTEDFNQELIILMEIETIPCSKIINTDVMLH